MNPESCEGLLARCLTEEWSLREAQRRLARGLEEARARASLERSRGNVVRAAASLGITSKALRDLAKRCGIQFEEFRTGDSVPPSSVSD